MFKAKVYPYNSTQIHVSVLNVPH